MTQKPQKDNTVLIVIAIIGIVGTIVAAAITVIGNYNVEKLRQDTELTRIALVSVPTQPKQTAISSSPTYLEDFSSGPKFWPIGEIDDEYATQSRKVNGNVYQWNVVSHKSSMVTTDAILPIASNFEMEIRLRHTGGNDDIYYGIRFRNDYQKGAYYFLINNQGKCEFIKLFYESGEYTPIFPQTDCPSIKKNGINVLRVSAISDKIGLFINDESISIGELQDNSYSMGTIAITASMPNPTTLSIEMSNFQLTSK